MKRAESRQRVKPKSDPEMIKGYKIKGKTFYMVKLQIADIIIQIKSRFKGELFAQRDSWRYENFLHRGNKKPQIILGVRIVDKLPRLNDSSRFFTTIHPELKEANWSLYRENSRYILRTHLAQKEQLIVLNLKFNKGIVYIPRNKNNDGKWRLAEIIYDALQIILINYFTKTDGILVHAVALKDIDATGRLFIGKSGSGKSTLARLWHNHSRAVILNDDRIIIRKIKGSFFIYGSPWHGDFSDYLISRMDSAQPAALLFIHHSKENRLSPISKKRAFNFLYPNIFPAFWDKKGLNKNIFFCLDLVENLPYYSLGFRDDKDIIGFVRKITNRRG